MAASLDFFGDAPEPPAPPTPAPTPPTKAAGAAADAGAPAPWSDDDVRAFRKRLRLRVESEDAVPRPWASWDDGTLDGRLRAALEACAWQEPTSVQAQACPALAAGRDALVTAPTGSGKTGAFVVPAAAFLLAREKKAAKFPAVAILAPTRELVAQIAREAARVLRGCGVEDAVAAAPWSGDVVARSSVLVSTPAPLRELYETTPKAASALRRLFVDEADKLLDLTPTAGLADASTRAPNAFVADVDAVLGARPKKCATALFSATMNEGVRELAANCLRADRVVLGVLPSLGPPLVEQRFAYVGEDGKRVEALAQAIREGFARPPCLVFARCAPAADAAAARLRALGYRAGCLHGGLGPRQRADALRDFRKGASWFLVCTDVASRGLDLRALETVVNLDAPASAADYVHRVGRVGRNGRAGRALTLYTSDDAAGLRAVANIAKQTGCADVPPWLLAKTTKKAWANADPRAKRKRDAPG